MKKQMIETPNIWSLDNISRCPDCNLISSLKLFYKKNKPIIHYYCDNNHKGDIPLEEYIQKYNAHSLLKEKCKECNKNQNEIKGDYLYCCKCDKFLCYLCALNHPNNEEHNTINFKRYDSFCKSHFNFFSFYCLKCNKNICIYCNNQHKSHEIINLSEFNIPEESKNKLETIIKNIEKKILDLDVIKEEIISEINNLKKSNELEMKFFKILINTFHYEESQKNINYYIIQNIKNFEEIFISDKIKLYEKVFKEGTKYISFLQNIRKNNNENNLIKNNFKTLNNHTGYVLYLTVLKDGRLISSSGDKLINIYRKDSFDLQLSIKEHSDYVYNVKQLLNGKIISCSRDNSINIIKLINEDKYILEQKLNEHKNYVYNVIEIRENELVSVSKDKTMKRWKINDDNIFKCTKTNIFQNSESVCNIFKINENEFVTTSEEEKCLKFWNYNDFSNISTINNINTGFYIRELCIIEDDILCIGGFESNCFYLIKISTHQIIKNIVGPKIIYSIYKCLDGLFLKMIMIIILLLNINMKIKI